MNILIVTSELTFFLTQSHIHVSFVGVVRAWWFTPQEASSCCSRAIGASWCRASSYSFGSICFGSVLVDLIQAIRGMLYLARKSNENGMLVCMIDCCFGLLLSMTEYVTPWLMSSWVSTDIAASTLPEMSCNYFIEEVGQRLVLFCLRSIFHFFKLPCWDICGNSSHYKSNFAGRLYIL